MALPTSRQQHIDYCLRNLGAPVLQINADPEQLEDRVDEALQYYRDYHFDGTSKTYRKHQLTATDISNQYITVPESIMGITRIFDFGSSLTSSSSLFDLKYQIHLNDLYDFSTTQIAPYAMTMTYIETLNEMFTGRKPIRFNRHQNKLHIDMDWSSDASAGRYIIIDCYEVVDPNIYTDVWNDRWLLRYTTALFKRQWGTNLSKFAGIQLPGNITLDGTRILNEAIEEINKLESEMINSFSLPVYDMIG